MIDRHERFVSHREVSRVSIVCRNEKCGAEVTFDPQNEEHCRRVSGDAYLIKCALCETEYDAGIRTASKALVAWYSAMKRSSHTMLLRIPGDTRT